MAWGPKDPATIPTKEAKRPRSCAGKTSPAGVKTKSSQDVTPKTIAKSAPCVVARFQYKPKTSGVKAPTKGI